MEIKLSMKKKIILIFAGALAVVGLIVTILLVQQQQDTRSRAEKATTLSLSPHKTTVKPGDVAEFDVNINPGVNQVNFIKFTVTYDGEKFNSQGSDFAKNSSLGFESLQEPSFLENKMSVSLGIGADGTKVITTAKTLGVLKLKVKTNASAGSTQIGFNQVETEVRSVGVPRDKFNENVLSNASSTTITIGDAVCRPNIATCSWDPVDGATTYHYKIYTGEQAAELLEEGDTSSTSVEFESEPGKSYSCQVAATSVCGTGPEGSDKVTCPVSPTPTPTVTPTPSPTPTVTPTPSPSPTPIVTPTPVVTTVVQQPPPEVIVSTVPVGGEVQIVTVTPVPTLPPTGNPVVLGGIIGGILFVLGGLALLFL